MLDNESYRIRTEVGKDNVLNINLNRDYKNFEVLSLKIETESLYKFHTADYGCIAGRVLANGNFGIPNAKISIFIGITDEDKSDAIISYLYPYGGTRDKNAEGIRYNLLSEEQLSDCHKNIGTFPSKRMVLDDNNVFEVYDKYYKYTTRSNGAGDYMIFGVPTGTQTIHVDIDLSDIGILSQKPRDMVYKGYNITQFENANMFKSSKDIDTLAQVVSQNTSVYVYPFWGEKSENEIAITRKDIEIQYNFETTCVFMGSIITDENSNAISKKCIPSERMGKMDRLTTGEGIIEMIRKKNDGRVEEIIVQGNQLIDGDGVWCYQIPMNLDYVKTDEYGNIVPTDDPNKGIATRARVRFRASLTEFDSDNQFSHSSKILIPNNPKSKEDVDYTFGSRTKDDDFGTKSFRDMFWNEVYSVKSYIPRFQQGNYNKNKRFSGIKAVNVNGANNPLPYNNMRVDLTFMFGLQCSIFHALLWIVGMVNNLINTIYDVLDILPNIKIGKCDCNPSGSYKKDAKYLYIGDGYCPDLQGWYFAPNATKTKLKENTLEYIKKEQNEDIKDLKSVEGKESEEDEDEKRCLTNNINYFIQCTEINMAMEYDVIQFDFYNDWVNGTVYSPRWYADVRKKQSYLFGLIKVAPRLFACMEDTFTNSRRFVQQCALSYEYDSDKKSYTKIVTSKGCVDNSKRQRCHKYSGRKFIKIFGKNGGVIHKELTLNKEYVYYAKPCEWHNDVKCNLFPTDIILVGSMNENDGQGIPQTFRKLVASSYQMPDPLASTNIGIEGYLYTDGNGSVCDGMSDKGVSVKTFENNFNDLMQWSSDTEEREEGYPYDKDERPMTEASGIDWGFSGPDQGSNDFDKLYFPGGHFLGISCTSSQVNVKSCINLSRICELGSSVSHRREIIKKDGEESYTYIYSIPNGLISKFDINDFGFKNEFATLNFNSLKTRINKENGLLEYDFETIIPVNFDGGLSKYVDKNDSYNEPYNNGEIFKQTVEENSKDYYRFRLGVHSDDSEDQKYADELTSKYLINDYSLVSLPMYENSFYFYFGLRNGNTALEKFYKNFFAECPVLNDYVPYVNIEYEDTDSCFDNGTIKIIVENVENPEYFLKGKENEKTPIINNKAIISNLKYGEYIVNVIGDNINTYEKSIKIGFKIPEEFNEIKIEVTNFEKSVYYTPENFKTQHDESKKGFFTIKELDDSNISSLWINTASNYHCIYGEDEVPSDFTDLRDVDYGNVPTDWKTSGCYVWEGNSTYTLSAIMNCGENGYKNLVAVKTFRVLMPNTLDIIFGGSGNEMTYNKIIAPILNKSDDKSDTWYEYILTGKTNDEYIYSESIRNKLKGGIVFKHPVTLYEPDDINVKIRYGSAPYEIKITGTEEILNEGQLTGKDMTGETITYLNGFYQPTRYGFTGEQYHVFNLTNAKEYSTVNPYSTNNSLTKNKKPYCLTVIDQNNDKIDRLVLHSLYLPFFFNALFVIDDRYEKDYCSLSIANGTLSNHKFASIDICNNELNENGKAKYYEDEVETYLKRTNSFKEKWGITPNLNSHGEDKNDITHMYEDRYAIRTLDYEFKNRLEGIFEVSVTDSNGDIISKGITAHFIGDKDKNGVYYSYDPDEDNYIKYYAINEKTAEFLGLGKSGSKMRSYYKGSDNSKILSFYSRENTEGIYKYYRASGPAGATDEEYERYVKSWNQYYYPLLDMTSERRNPSGGDDKYPYFEDEGQINIGWCSDLMKTPIEAYAISEYSRIEWTGENERFSKELRCAYWIKSNPSTFEFDIHKAITGQTKEFPYVIGVYDTTFNSDKDKRKDFDVDKRNCNLIKAIKIYNASSFAKYQADLGLLTT